jgi:hypothetical protein
VLGRDQTQSATARWLNSLNDILLRLGNNWTFHVTAAPSLLHDGLSATATPLWPPPSVRAHRRRRVRHVNIGRARDPEALARPHLPPHKPVRPDDSA